MRFWEFYYNLMIWPYRGNYTITQKFGLNPDMYKKFGLLGHNGIDIGLPTGTQVIAPHDGKITEIYNDLQGYGNYIKMENAKEGSVLAHLQSFQCKVGDMVSEGQPIALSDNTGNSTGPHLHWGYYLFPRNRNNGYNGYIDQLPLIRQDVTISQKELDDLRKARDDNWNLAEKYKSEKENLQREINAIDNVIGKYQEGLQDITNIIEKLRVY